MMMNDPPFPVKLYELLEEADRRGFEDVISWQSSGRSFAIHQPQVFQEHILPNFFYSHAAHHQKYKSWIRQLNNYGFRKIKMGSLKGGYCHPKFIRGHSDLLPWVNHLSKTPPTTTSGQPTPTKPLPGQPLVKGSPICQRPNRTSSDFSGDAVAEWIDTDPSFLQFFDSCCSSTVSSSCNDGQVASLNLSLETDFDYVWDDAPPIYDDFIQTMLQDSHNELQDSHNGLVESAKDETTKDIATTCSAYTATASTITASASASTAACPIQQQEQQEQQQEELLDDNCPDVVTSEDVSFPVKLYMMLENAPARGYADIVSWVKDGKAFKVHDHRRFVAFVLPSYFNQSKYESFRRQLSHYKFQREARGPDRGVISHPKLVAGAKALSRNIQRSIPLVAKREID